MNNLIIQIAISVIVPIVTSIIAYFKSVNKTKITTENELNKIKEDYNEQIKKLKAETDQKIKLMEKEYQLASKKQIDDYQNEFTKNLLGEFINNPQKTADKLKSMQNIAKQFKSNNK